MRRSQFTARAPTARFVAVRAARDPIPCSTTLTERLSRVVKTLRGEARLTDDEHPGRAARGAPRAARSRRRAAGRQEFVADVRDKAIGAEVVGSLTPGQALIGVVAARADGADGRRRAAARPRHAPPAVILLAGLQGAGKTTTAGEARAPARRRRRRRCCWSRPTSTGPRRSSSCRRSPRRSASISSRRRPTRSRSRSRKRARRLGAAALPRRADRRHRGPPGDRRGDDARDRRRCTPR